MSASSALRAGTRNRARSRPQAGTRRPAKRWWRHRLAMRIPPSRHIPPPPRACAGRDRRRWDHRRDARAPPRRWPGPRSYQVRQLARRDSSIATVDAVGTSWPTSERKLAKPIPATPGVSQRVRVPSASDVTIGIRVRRSPFMDAAATEDSMSASGQEQPMLKSSGVVVQRMRTPRRTRTSARAVPQHSRL